MTLFIFIHLNNRNDYNAYRPTHSAEWPLTCWSAQLTERSTWKLQRHPLCTLSTLWSYLEYLVMKADSRSLYGESDWWVWSLRSLWTTDERSRRLWLNPTRLEVNQYKAMDWKGGDKLVLECQCWPSDRKITLFLIKRWEQGIHINWSEVRPNKRNQHLTWFYIWCVFLNAAVMVCLFEPLA